MPIKPQIHAEILAKMKQDYGANVAWAHGKGERVPKDYTWAVQTRVVSVDKMGISSMQARIIVAGIHKDRAISDWVTLDTPGEVRRQIARAVDRVIKLPLRDLDPNLDVALGQGREILKKLGAHVHVCKFNENYLQVWFPTYNYPSELETVLKFSLWTNKEPARRKWRSKGNRDSLYASGCYAWNVLLDLRIEQACIYYANCILHKSKSEWFPWDALHEKLWEQTNRAEAGSWRDSELYLQQKENHDIAKAELKEILATLDPNDKFDRMQIDLLKKEFEQIYGYNSAEPVLSKAIGVSVIPSAKPELAEPAKAEPVKAEFGSDEAAEDARLEAAHIKLMLLKNAPKKTVDHVVDPNDLDDDPDQPTGGISFDVMDKKIHD